jgi:DNA-directed RNA polymerase III subunit RPC1
MKFYDTNEFDKIQFFYPSFSETISSSQSQISTPFLHSQYFSKPCSGGIIDGKLGSFDNHQCITCSKSHKMCSGHFGFLKLFLPVFNVGYIKVIHGILQIICKNCSRVLLKEGPGYQKILKFIHFILPIR